MRAKLDNCPGGIEMKDMIIYMAIFFLLINGGLWRIDSTLRKILDEVKKGH